MSSLATVIVTGAGGPLGVNFSRSVRLADRALRLIGTDANRWHLPLSLCDATYRIPLAARLEAYAAALGRLAERERATAIVPTHPVEVRAVARLRDEGRLAGLGTALPRSEVLEIADDKAATQERLAAAGVPVPRTIRLDAEEGLARAFAELAGDDGTIWVRGTGVPGIGIGGAALPCRDQHVARAWIDVHDGWGRMAASEYLPGANLTWMAAFHRGELIAAAARERLEYVLPHVSPSGITGAPAVSRTISRADVSEIGERAVRALDSQPHGVYFVDLKEDVGGRPLVTEINAGRCGTTVHFYTEAGYNFPSLLVDMALGGEPIAEAAPNDVVPAGLYWVRTLDCGPVLVRGEREFDAYPALGLDGP